MNIEIICPLYKAENYIVDLDNNIKKQKNVNIKKISYVLTESSDNTEKLLKKINATYSKLKKEEFSHSTARENVAKKSDADIVVFITQDIDIRNNDWLEKLYNAYLDDPDCIYSHRAHQITFDDNNIKPYSEWIKCISSPDKSFLNFSTGSGGILYPPNSLFDDVANESLFMKLTPMADDIWFWAMAVLNDKKNKIVDNNYSQLTYINPERELGLNGEITLYKINGINGKNDIQIQNITNYYPSLKEKLLKE